MGLETITTTNNAKAYVQDSVGAEYENTKHIVLVPENKHISMTMLRIKLEYLKKQKKFYTDKAQVWTFAAVAFFF